MVILKSPKEIQKIKKSNELVAEILSILVSEVKPGINTLYLNDLSEKLALKRHAVPAFKGYRGFPYALCASANNVVVHGFPNKKPLKNKMDTIQRVQNRDLKTKSRPRRFELLAF